MLDPQRIGLNAASVGFLARTGQKVDWASFNQALQTDDSRVADVRAEMETPVDELHVMGGQRFGLEGNSNLKMSARQERQINGYPLRSFSAEAPSIILPDKYGGLPMYTRNQTEYKDFVSSFTAPLSGVLQNDTVLLGRQGYSVTNESASQPYKDVGFEHNMHKSKSAIDYNTAMINQRRWLQIQSREARQQKYGKEVQKRRGLGPKETGGIVFPADNSNRGMGDGVFIGADGRPMTQVQDEANGDQLAQAVLEIPQQRVEENSFLPGTNHLNPSVDKTTQFLPARRASNAIARQMLPNRNVDPEDLPILRQQAAEFIVRAVEHPLRQGFNRMLINSMLRSDQPRYRDLQGMEGADAESRANQIIMGEALRNRVSFGGGVIHTELGDMFDPLYSQRTRGFIPVGQASALREPLAPPILGTRRTPYSRTSAEDRALVNQAQAIHLPQTPVRTRPIISRERLRPTRTSPTMGGRGQRHNERRK